MTLRNLIGWKGLTLAAAATFGLVGMTAAPQKAHAVSPGAAVGIGLGAFALGSALAAGPAPYYPGYGYYGYPGYYAPPAPAYYSPYAPRQCWNPYYNQYYAC
jgi:hypothetical protein